MQILRVRFRSNEEFESHYDSAIANGGLFCPTTAPLGEKQSVIVELSVPALPNKVLIRGTVVSWRPALPRLRVRAGAVVEFDSEEAEKHAFIVETVAGERAPSPRRKHTRLPISVPVRYRLKRDSEYTLGELSEISVGGATLLSDAPVPVDTDVIVEITPPGAEIPFAISGKATYAVDSGAGLKFASRDLAGARRLRELVRRLRTE